MIAPEAGLSVSRQCALLGVARSSFYYRPRPEAAEELELLKRLDRVFTDHPVYGSRRLQVALLREGISAGRRRVRRLMRKLGLWAVRPKRNTSKRHPGHKVYPYLLRGETIDQPNQVWAADITYISVFACMVMALLLGLAELIARHQRSFERVGLLDCLVVGIAQVGALIPGVSRSGSTLTAALFLGFKREEAGRFSFLLGLPAIALAGLKELAELRHAGLDAHGWLVLAVGLVIGSLSAFVAIWGVMRILEHFG